MLSTLLLLLCVASAGAAKPRLRLERVDGRSCARDHVVRAYVSELELDGGLRSRPLSEYRLIAGGRVVAERPVRAERFAGLDDPLWLTLIIERGAAYEADLAEIRRATAAFVDALPPRGRISVFEYSDTARRLASAVEPGLARDAIERIRTDSQAVDLALLDALRLGLGELSAATPPTRRLLVVVSDGIDRQPDWEGFRRIGQRARALRIPVLPIAYSPIDERGPLLNLGEIAKRSHGIFRWARRREDLSRAFNSLARQINEQLVITFRPPSCDRDALWQVAAGGLHSNQLTATWERDSPAEQADRPWWWGALFVVLAALAVVALVGVTRWLIRGIR